jgi:hypothetical protein
VEAMRRSDDCLIKAVSAHLPYAVSQSQGGLVIVTPIDRNRPSLKLIRCKHIGFGSCYELVSQVVYDSY